MACLDTTVILDLAGSGGKPAMSRATACVTQLLKQGEALCTTRLNVAELWVGVFRSKSPAVEQKRIEDALDRLVILELDSSAARTFGQVGADLLRRGRPVGEMDALIAAIALDAGESIVTRNTRHFDEIAGLRVIGY